MKEIKNSVEITGMQACHLRDCGAVVPPHTSFSPLPRFRADNECDTFGWLEEMVYFGNMVKEFYISIKLKEFQEFIPNEMLTYLENL
jgi:hypothetical protein